MQGRSFLIPVGQQIMGFLSHCIFYALWGKSSGEEGTCFWETQSLLCTVCQSKGRYIRFLHLRAGDYFPFR